MRIFTLSLIAVVAQLAGSHDIAAGCAIAAIVMLTVLPKEERHG
jgi:hypothetical protein